MEQEADENWTNPTSPPPPWVSVFSLPNLLYHVKITTLKINCGDGH